MFLCFVASIFPYFEQKNFPSIIPTWSFFPFMYKLLVCKYCAWHDLATVLYFAIELKQTENFSITRCLALHFHLSNSVDIKKKKIFLNSTEWLPLTGTVKWPFYGMVASDIESKRFSLARIGENWLPRPNPYNKLAVSLSLNNLVDLLLILAFKELTLISGGAKNLT